GRTDAAAAVAAVRRRAEKAADSVDYVVAVDKDTLEPVSELRRGVLVALAARFGTTRLIDNHVLR
ncbi:MAG: pantoate--beta-alanine ligase, partial [Kiritimatiellae bacterium]|nr:pantoate--beta-alanine ligase [Kiritimatiellia bacterium]